MARVGRRAVVLAVVLSACAAVPLDPGPRFGIATATLAGPAGRAVEVRLLHPRCERGRRYPLLLLSHGANSAPAKYDRLTAAWAARDYLVAAPLHADSPDHPGGGKIDPARSWAYRIEDMRLPIDSSGELERATGCAIDRARIAATGHSYGALIAQALGGARSENAPPARDPRVRAVIAFSPPGPIAGYITPRGWSATAVPMLVQTGTADVLPMIAPRWEAHRASFDAATAVPRVLFVGEGVDHYFGNIIGRPERTEPPAAAAFDEAAALSTRFLALALGGRAPSAYRALARPRAAGRSWVEVATP